MHATSRCVHMYSSSTFGMRWTRGRKHQEALKVSRGKQGGEGDSIPCSSRGSLSPCAFLWPPAGPLWWLLGSLLMGSSRSPVSAGEAGAAFAAPAVLGTPLPLPDHLHLAGAVLIVCTICSPLWLRLLGVSSQFLWRRGDLQGHRHWAADQQKTQGKETLSTTPRAPPQAERGLMRSLG